MGLSELKGMDKEVLTAAEIAPIIGVQPQYIRRAARDFPERLGFPVIVVGKCVKIPRRAFLRFMEGQVSG